MKDPKQRFRYQWPARRLPKAPEPRGGAPQPIVTRPALLPVMPDQAAVDHLRRTWRPPLPLIRAPYLAGSQVITLAVMTELGWRYIGWRAWLGSQEQAPGGAQSAALADEWQDGPIALTQDIQSWRVAFAWWAEDVGTQATALWQAWAPGFVHPDVPGEDEAALACLYRAQLDVLWEAQLALPVTTPTLPGSRKGGQ